MKISYLIKNEYLKDHLQNILSKKLISTLKHPKSTILRVALEFEKSVLHFGTLKVNIPNPRGNNLI